MQATMSLQRPVHVGYCLSFIARRACITRHDLVKTMAWLVDFVIVLLGLAPRCMTTASFDLVDLAYKSVGVGNLFRSSKQVPLEEKVYHWY